MLINRPQWVASRSYNGEVVAYNLAAGTITVLEGTAAAIWDRIPFAPESADLDAIASALTERFAVSSETAIADSLSFIADLSRRGLVNSDSTSYVNGSEAVYKDPENAANITEDDIERSVARRNQIYADTFELTGSCTEKCVHCYIVRPRREVAHLELQTKEWLRVIDELEGLGCLRLTLTGGDPLVRRDFAEIFEYARRKHYAVYVFTNGYNASNEAVQRLSNNYPRAVYISLYSMIPEIHDAITRVPGSFARTISGIKCLKQARVNVVLNITVTNLNAECYEGVVRYAEEMDLEYRTSLETIPRVNSGSDPLELYPKVGDSIN